MKLLLVFVLTLISLNIYADYTKVELKRKVWDLEKTVTRLQRKVSNLQSNSFGGDTWVCKIHAMGEDYMSTGGSKVVATVRAIEKCKTGRDGSDFFCKSVSCEQ